MSRIALTVGVMMDPFRVVNALQSRARHNEEIAFPRKNPRSVRCTREFTAAEPAKILPNFLWGTEARVLANDRRGLDQIGKNFLNRKVSSNLSVKKITVTGALHWVRG